jgi:hypothetical protein
VLLPAAEPWHAAGKDAVAAPTVSPEYVYLLRVVVALLMFPNAKIPTVLLPVAEPEYDAAVAAPPALTTSPE